MLALLALALAPASPQDLALRSREIFDRPDPDVIDARAIAEYPDGGAVASAIFGYRDVLNWRIDGMVARVDADGRALWRSEFPIVAASDTGAVIAPAEIAVLSDGAVVAAFSDAPALASVLLRCLEPNGALRWERQFDDVSGTFDRAKVGALGAAADADALLHFERRVLASDGAAQVVALRLDGSTGADVWRQDRPALSPGDVPVPARAGIQDEALYFVERRVDSSHWAMKYDSSGTVVYGTDVPLGMFPAAGPTFAVTPQGGVAVGTFRTIAFLDPVGQVFAEVAVLGNRHLRATPQGGIVALRAGAVDGYDASGGLLWTRPLSNAVDLTATADGGARVLRFNASAPNFPLFLTEVNGSGQVVQSLDLSTPGERPAILVPGSVKPDGSLWCLVTYANVGIGSIGPVTVTGVGPDSVDSVSACTAAAPNSTGALGEIRAVGDGAAAGDEVVLFADGLPPFQTVLFLNSRQPGNMPMLGGGVGTLCLGGSVNRYLGPGEVSFSNDFGNAWLRLSLPNTPDGSVVSPVLAGETWYYQAWHRDVVGGAQVTNLTGAVAVTYR